MNGDHVGDLQIAVKDDQIGWITLDDNADLPDEHLPRFTLEYRNETEWNRIDPVLRRISRDKGWRTVTPDELIRVLITAGVIDVR